MAQIKTRINKLQEKLKFEQNGLKDKNLLLQKIIKKYQEYKKVEDKLEKEYESISKQLINQNDQVYQQQVETQNQQYQITLLNFEVDKKAFEKAPFMYKQQFLQYREQDQQALQELSQIRKEQEQVRVKQKKSVQMNNKVKQLTQNQDRVLKELNHNRYQRIYYEQMRDDTKVIIQQKQNYIQNLRQSISTEQQALEYWNYEQECAKYNDDTFLQCLKNDKIV